MAASEVRRVRSWWPGGTRIVCATIGLLMVLASGVAPVGAQIPMDETVPPYPSTTLAPCDVVVADDAGAFVDPAGVAEAANRIDDRFDLVVRIRTVPTFGGRPGLAVADELARGRCPGWWVSDDLLLVLVARDDRTATIWFGRGLEGRLRDIDALYAQHLAPQLQEGDADGAVRAGLDAIAVSFDAQYVERERQEVGRAAAAGPWWRPFVTAPVILTLITLVVRRSTTTRRPSRLLPPPPAPATGAHLPPPPPEAGWAHLPPPPDPQPVRSMRR